MKMNFKVKMNQKKLTDMIEELPHQEKIKCKEEDERQKRFELREMKANIWKWRGRKEKGKKEEKKTRQETLEDLEDNIKKIEELLERAKLDKEERLNRAKKKQLEEHEKRTKKMKLEEEKRRKPIWKKVGAC